MAIANSSGRYRDLNVSGFTALRLPTVAAGAFAKVWRAAAVRSVVIGKAGGLAEPRWALLHGDVNPRIRHYNFESGLAILVGSGGVGAVDDGFDGALSSAVRAFGLHPKGRRFKSFSAHQISSLYSPKKSFTERSEDKVQVIGSGAARGFQSWRRAMMGSTWVARRAGR
jgi:hypothetical protein